MKFKHYLDRVKESGEFKKFKEKNPKAYLAAGFFVLDFETDNNIHQIDFALPNKKVATFLLDDGTKVKISEQALKKKLPEIKDEDAKTDLDALKGIVEDEMKNRTVTEKIRKMIAILHMIDDKLIWNIQCILDGLGFLSIHVSDDDQTVMKFEKHSLLDLIKTPGQVMMMKPKEGEGKEEGHVPGGQPKEEITPEQQAEQEAKAKSIIEQIKQKIAEEKKRQEAKEKKKSEKKTSKKKTKKK
jgi:hypothetical protein